MRQITSTANNGAPTGALPDAVRVRWTGHREARTAHGAGGRGIDDVTGDASAIAD
ncbi:MAG: hypothetical protein ACRDVW_06680 [Acidimicrobiales bacterium]